MKNKKQVIRLLTLILICVIFFFVIVAAFYVVSMHKQDLIEEAKYKGLYSTTKVKDLYDIDLDEMKQYRVQMPILKDTKSQYKMTEK